MPLKQKATKSARPMAGTILKGKTSWFGGPNDSTDSGHTALGVTTATPGIAVYNQATLGGYWSVTFPNGRTAVLQQTDIGPAPWTGRVVDVTYSALPQIGYGEGDFPTDGEVTASYLGKNKQAAISAAGQDSVGNVAGEVTGEGAAHDASLKSDVEAGFSIAKDLATGNYEDLGAKFAMVGLQLAKDFAVGFVDLIIAPAWHWNQRTVAWYSKYVLDPRKYGDGSENQWAFAWTAAFWGVGYAILWTDPSGKLITPVPVKKARLGHHVRKLQAIPARKSLIKPRDVKRRTPVKPKPTVSRAVIEHTDIMTTVRKRTVRVTSYGTTNNSPRSAENAAESQAPVKRVKISPDGEIKRNPKPDKAADIRARAPEDIRGTTEGTPKKG